MAEANSLTLKKRISKSIHLTDITHILKISILNNSL